MALTDDAVRSDVLECRGLVKTFGGLRAVDEVDAAFEPGRVTALVGPNGAGKTTFFHLLAGALRPDRGEVRYGGVRVDRLASWKIASRGVGRLFQDVRVFKRLTALENVLAAFPAQLGEQPAWAVLRRRAMREEEARLATRAEALLDSVGLLEFRGRAAESLSYGQQKLVALARLAAGGATALLLDEPTAGVAPGLLPTVTSFMRDQARAGRTVVVIEHNMGVVMDVADWVFFLDEGQIVAFGTPREVLDDPEVRSAYLGL